MNHQTGLIFEVHGFRVRQETYAISSAFIVVMSPAYFPHAPTALASKGPGAASLLMVDCETP
jgi:hypothetical protein